MIDVSHANSASSTSARSTSATTWRRSIAAGEQRIVGVMIESHLHDGRQELRARRARCDYGVSITDACLGWTQTQPVLEELAQAVRTRRSQAGVLRR